MANKITLNCSEFLEFLAKNIIKCKESEINETDLFCAMNTARMFGKLERLTNDGFKGTLRINSWGAMFNLSAHGEFGEPPNAIFFDLEYKDGIYTLKQIKEIREI